MGSLLCTRRCVECVCVCVGVCVCVCGCVWVCGRGVGREWVEKSGRKGGGGEEGRREVECDGN